MNNNEHIHINGQDLDVIHLHGLIHIKHPDFIVSGSGVTMEEAKDDLQVCCKTLMDSFPELIPPVYDRWVQQVATSDHI